MVGSQQLTCSVPACSQAPLGQSCCCCRRCGYGGCDLRLLDCGCCFHTRCYPAAAMTTLTNCPLCSLPARSLLLLPMTFDEIDRAQAEAASTSMSDKRGKKRKNATISRLVDNESTDLRTGRWTNEETAYCDKLVELFERGLLPLPDGIKLNDFLSSMLKSKQSRLTKKMKNAKLSARLYKRTLGYVESDDEAKALSIMETEFFASSRCNMERSEIRFHMQKEWRELFSNYCVGVGVTLDANDWLHSVEELDRRASMQKDAARMARRKVMMGYALRQDSMNPQNGVFIDPNVNAATRGHTSLLHSSSGNSSDTDSRKKRLKRLQEKTRPKHYSSLFIGKVIEYIQRHALPFEHVDAWVPSFVPAPGGNAAEQKCRLFFAGCGTAETQVTASGAVRLTNEEFYDWSSFGFYSEKFSFDVGSGLPGRVYESGISSWEQGIQNAPSGQFERKGGAIQWGVQTVLGVPIPSPNVGRIVLLFYSRFDRPKPKDQNLVNRISTELTKLMPSPKWKLVVDVGMTPSPSAATDPQTEAQVRELVTAVQTYMPEDKSSPLAALLPGFTSLRLLLLKQTHTGRDRELLLSALQSFKNYKRAGHADNEAVSMTARDFMMNTRPQACNRNYKPSSAAALTVRPSPVVPAVQQQPTFPNPLTSLPAQQITAATPMLSQPVPPRSDAVHDVAGALAAESNLLVGNSAGDLSHASPTLLALAGQSDMLSLNLTAAQLSAVLQNDAMSFQSN